MFPTLLFAVWSLVFPLSKWMTEHGSPLLLTAMRMVFAGLILCVYIFFKNRNAFVMSKRGWISVFLLAFLNVFLSNALEMWGIARISAAKACFIYSFSPFFTAFLSYLHFKEKMTPKKWLGLCIGFFSCLPPIFMSGSEGIFASSQISYLPELSVVLAAFFAVWGWVLLRIVVKDENISPMSANGSSMLLGGLFSCIALFAWDGSSGFSLNSGSIGKLSAMIVLVTFISNILCTNFYGYLLRTYTATLLSLFGLLSPFFASIHSWILLGEAPSLLILASSCMTIAGLFIVYQEEKKQGYLKQELS